MDGETASDSVDQEVTVVSSVRARQMPPGSWSFCEPVLSVGAVPSRPVNKLDYGWCVFVCVCMGESEKESHFE